MDLNSPPLTDPSRCEIHQFATAGRAPDSTRFLARKAHMRGKGIGSPAMAKPPNKRPGEVSVRGLQRLIALKYQRDPRRGTRSKPDRSGVRLKDLMRLLHYRMQQSKIPDDWLAWNVHGREISRVIISHLAQMPNANERIEQFTTRYPGLPQSQINAIVAKPRRWNAEHLDNLLSLTPDERAYLRITTIRARATPTRELKPAKRERARISRTCPPPRAVTAFTLHRKSPLVAAGPSVTASEPSTTGESPPRARVGTVHKRSQSWFLRRVRTHRPARSCVHAGDSNAYSSLFSSLFFFDPPSRFVQIPQDLA
jgi:hypothetical protein